MSDAMRSLLQSSSSRHRPWQLAASIAMGVVCGLLPKLTFTFGLVGLLCWLLPIHVPMTAIVCGLVSLTLPTFTPLIGRIGIWSLTHPSLSNYWLRLDAFPLIPWLGFNNSLVHGGLLIGLALWLPIYWSVKPIARRWLPIEDLSRAALTAGTTDRDFEHELKPTVADQNGPLRNPSEPPIQVAITRAIMESTLDRSQEVFAEACAQDCMPVATTQPHTASYSNLKELLEQCPHTDASQLSVEKVVERASQIAEYVDELLSSCESDPHPCDTGQAIDETPQLKVAETVLPLASQRSVAVVETGVETGYTARSDGGLLKRHTQHSATVVAAPSPQTAPQTVPRRAPIGDQRQQEALRYLLHHLKAFKDKV